MVESALAPRAALDRALVIAMYTDRQTSTRSNQQLSETTDRVWGLDFARAAAIALVLLAHGSVFTVGTWPWTSALRVGGLHGVEVFFALSGFLIGGILYRSHAAGALSIPTFWRRRWLRTIPAYLVFFLLNLGFMRSVGIEIQVDWRYFIYLQNLNWPHPEFFPEAWSLAVEEWFYLLTPLLLVGMTRFMPRRRAFLVTATLIGNEHDAAIL